MLGKPTIRMPIAIDPSIVKIAVELENHTAQLIEFDQKNLLTGNFDVLLLSQLDSITLANYLLIFRSYNSKSLSKLECV